MASTAPTLADEGADYSPSAEMKKVAIALIRRHSGIAALVEDLRIAYLERAGEPSGEGEEAIAKCQKASPLWRDLAEYDVVIWAWSYWWDLFEPRQREALMLHELCHIDRTEKGGVKMRRHDVEEFIAVVHQYGVWDGFSHLRDFGRALARHSDEAKVTSIDKGKRS